MVDILQKNRYKNTFYMVMPNNINYFLINFFKMKLNNSLIFLLLILSSCATNPTSPQIKPGERQTLAFTGKGAAAGMMMDAYMGGMGVAIGIAIDEGIAKDISTNIEKRPNGFSMVTLVEKEISSQHASQKISKSSNLSTAASTQITIDTYGFRTFPGEGDKVTAWVKMRFTNKNGELIVTHPNDFISPQSAELSEVKTNSKLAYDMLKNATDEIISRWIANAK